MWHKDINKINLTYISHLQSVLTNKLRKTSAAEIKPPPAVNPPTQPGRAQRAFWVLGPHDSVQFRGALSSWLVGDVVILYMYITVGWKLEVSSWLCSETVAVPTVLLCHMTSSAHEQGRGSLKRPEFIKEDFYKYFSKYVVKGYYKLRNVIRTSLWVIHYLSWTVQSDYPGVEL